MTEYRKTLTNILEETHTWDEVKIELSKYTIHNSEEEEKGTRAGKIFVVFTQLYFRLSPTEKDNFSNVWLFDEAPKEIRNKLNLKAQDSGVDLVLEDIDGKLFFVLCKFKNDESSRLNWSADEIAKLFAFCPDTDHYILFSNAAALDQVSKTRHDNFTFYSVTELQEIDSGTFKSFHESLCGSNISKRILFEPKPYQKEAIKDCIDFFETENRGRLILPCGAGKTYTALWIKEGLKSRNTLVLVPSLALLRQIKNEWAKQRRTTYRYICVGSESDIDRDTKDSVVAYTYEIDTRLSTDPNRIKNFILKDDAESVIFSTFHSLNAISEAIHGLDFEFDFLFCDEAHISAGVGMNTFSLIHDNQKIPSKRRLYATGTPRIVKESLKKKLGDDLKFAYDMTDPNTFGREFYRMTFKEAIEQDVLVDYKIVAVGVNSDELKDYVENRRFGNAILSTDELANNYALNHIMKKYSAYHAFTFHSSVKLANKFANRHSTLFPETSTFSVHGDQATSYRNLVLNDFKNSQIAIVSNAGCLTEVPDVPPTDLVYFCDPKNSKVDIVRAVGRALGKREGKKTGLVVVPIYPSHASELEESIRSGTLHNLLQVIRSLCDQDERLQDEINSLAYGKGQRKSLRTDHVSSGSIEEQDTILLEGFEEGLKNSLFAQIIEKTSNNWDLWFLKLKEFLDRNPGYPTQVGDSKLYLWIAQQRSRKKHGTLKNEEIRKLNAIHFAWSIVEWKWNKMFEVFSQYANTNEFPPSKGIDDDGLVTWYSYQQTCIYKNKVLSSDQKEKFLSIGEKFLGPASRKKWIAVYEDLVDFRKKNPERWPHYNKEVKNSNENGLYVFLQTIRKKFRDNDLEDYWFDKMTQIDFTFENKRTNWTIYFEEVRDLISGKESLIVKDIGNNAYCWILRHKNKLEEGTLSAYKSKKIQSLKLDRFFERWDEKYEKVKLWVKEHGKTPTKSAHKDYYSWLISQRSRYKNGNLSDEQISKLKEIEFDLDALGKERNEQKWLDQFHLYKNFRARYGKNPSYIIGDESEKSLYVWVMAQRAVMAGNARNRKALSKQRIELLNSINFQWIGNRRVNQRWEESFAKFVNYIKADGRLVLPTVIDGKRNILYTWWRHQKDAFDMGLLSEKKIKSFKKVGINLIDPRFYSKRDGFTRWANNLHEIADFIAQNGHNPKARKDKKQSNLYRSLAKKKREFVNNELSERQLELIKQLGMELE